MSNLLKLLQPPTYKSKIKLYCPFSEIKVNKYSNIVADVKNNSYFRRIIIKEVEKC